MAALEPMRLGGVSSSGSLTGGAGEFTRGIENEAELEDGLTRAAHGRLDSWKEIAVYLSRSVRCVQRWERLEAMPVHRHQHRRGASVYAYRYELDKWWTQAAPWSTYSRTPANSRGRNGLR